ncbi:MAG: hypothetical protein MJZ83_10715 [Bacteroidaceae bacterium]|nr:hypothetical protein [Bacteroidaceae bacterium]
MKLLRFFFLMGLLFFLALPSEAQMKTVTGRILQTQFGNEKSKPFEEEVHVFGFNTKGEFKKAQTALETPGSFITSFDSETIADENGYYTIQVAPTGYLLVVAGGLSHASEEVKKRLVINFQIDAGVQLNTVNVLGKAKVALIDSMDVIDTGATLVASSNITIPDAVGQHNARLVFQPVVIDCQTGDTVQFLAPKVFDGREYRTAMLQRMGFKKERDLLSAYVQPEELSAEKLKIRWSENIQKKDKTHTYTCMAGMRIVDFNSILYREDKQVSSCLARRPFQFLEFQATYPDLNDQDYKEVPRGELRDGAENISLSFLVGKAVLDPDPKNELELNRLNSTLQHIDKDGEYQLRRVAITGYASPEGNYQNNLELARKRAEVAKSLVSRNFSHDIYVYTGTPQVIGWDVVADSLALQGHQELALKVRDIVSQVKDLTLQSRRVSSLNGYEELIKPILPHLRLFKCEYAYQTVRAMEPEEIMDAYMNDPEYRVGGSKHFNHYDYWNLFQMIKDPSELEGLYRRAYQESVQNEARPWVYAAHKLALSYLRRDTCDVNLLRPFIDVNTSNVNVERTTFAGRKYKINQEEVLAAQVAAYYMTEQTDTAYYLARMLPDTEKYRQVRSFALVRGLLFYPHKNDEQKALLQEALPQVMGTSVLNKAVLQVAMKQDADAAETLALLPETDPRRWYMAAILDSRAMDLTQGATDLNQCFTLDNTYQLKMVNDGDLSDDLKDVWELTYGF